MFGCLELCCLFITLLCVRYISMLKVFRIVIFGLLVYSVCVHILFLLNPHFFHVSSMKIFGHGFIICFGQKYETIH